jgi:transcriptional regulator with XRE-family HTH domain
MCRSFLEGTQPVAVAEFHVKREYRGNVHPAISPDRASPPFTLGVMVPLMRGRRPAEPQKHYPNRLRHWRQERGLSLEKLADLTNQKHQSVARHETGLNQMTVAQMELYAKALQIKPEELLNDSVRITAPMRGLIAMLENLPPTEQERLLDMIRAFAEPRQQGVAAPTSVAPQRKRVGA